MRAKKKHKKRLTEDQRILKTMQELDKKCLRLAKLKARVALFFSPREINRFLDAA